MDEVDIFNTCDINTFKLFLMATKGDARISIRAKEYVDNEVRHLENKVDIRTELNALALEKATLRLDDRLEGMNEFREQLNKQAGTFATKESLEALRESLDLKFDELRRKNAAQDRLIYIGVGAVLVIQIALRIFT